MQGNNLKERCQFQLEEWVKGNSIHNDVDEQCCPDFSCCRKNVNTPVEKRQEYLKIYNEQGPDGCVEMLGGFLSNMLLTSGKEMNVEIIGAHKPGTGTCSECKKEFENADLRPYGANGADICYDCGMLPENIKRTEAMHDGREFPQTTTDN